eukprot:gene14968-20136_t
MESLIFLDIDILHFDNRNIDLLPVDVSINNPPTVSRNTPNAIFVIAKPTTVVNPKLVIKSNDGLRLLGLDSHLPDEVYSLYFSGNQLIPGSYPAAHCYCGHQFGSFAGQLGDGATMYIGEVINPNTNERWELQFKGAGKTAFSRTADGRKVLRSSVREFLCSEAMYYLDVPTTRAATCVTSDSFVERDPLYDGRVINERCTVISRVAPNFFRFGSFEIFKTKDNKDSSSRAGPSAGNLDLKIKLFNHILLYFPQFSGLSQNDQYIAAYKDIVSKTANLVAKWQAVGFVHGVLNTDNMSIMGLTIDYGPFGFMEYFDPEFVPNGSDNSARYSFIQQPSVCKWNLKKLAEVLDPVIPFEISSNILETNYDNEYKISYLRQMRSKFGFINEDESDESFIQDFFRIMEETNCDFTNSFVALTESIDEMNSNDFNSLNQNILVKKLVSQCASPSALIASNKRKMKIHRLGMHPDQIQQLAEMLDNDPKVVAELFGDAPIDIIQDEINGEKRKLDILQKAYNNVKKYEMSSLEQKQTKDTNLWREWVNAYVNRLKNDDNNVLNSESVMINRLSLMKKSNPTFILRNWIAQDCISAAEKGNFNKIHEVFAMLQEPYNQKYSTFNSLTSCFRNQQQENILTETEEKYISSSPEWADELICTCSS